jgi:diaminopimelate epimerase
MKIPYTKMHGCRNDYLYIDNLSGEWSSYLTPEKSSALSKRYANRTTGIGADGIIIVEKADVAGADARMRMYNLDGSEGKMCGNGIRCVAKLLHEKQGAKPSFKISTASGIRKCFVLEAKDPKRFMVRVNMGRPSFLPANLPVLFDDVMVMDEEFEIEDKTFKISCVSMGNPHCVIEVPNLERFDVARYGSKIEKHEAFPEKFLF